MPCFKYGYKNVQAMRVWHGQPGYFFNNPLGIYQCTDGTGPDCDLELYQPYSNTAGQTKYTELSATAYFTGTSEGVTSTGTQNISLSLDPLSGVITNTSSATGSPSQCCAFAAGNLTFSANDLASIMGNSPTQWWNLFWDEIYEGPFSGDDIITCTEGSYTDEYVFDGTPNGVVITITWDISDTSLAMTYSQTNGEGDTVLSASLSVSDSSVSLTITGNDPDAEETSYSSLDVTLSGANTSADLQADIATLLDEWDLTDDTQYPWRTDSYTSIAPLVTRNEVPSPVTLFGFGAFTASGTVLSEACGEFTSDCSDPFYEQVALMDINATVYDGSIIGAPMPAGYQNYFDFGFVDWENCVSGDVTGLYVYGYGQNAGQGHANSGYGIPLNSTQWTPNNLAQNFGPGAWIFYALGPSWENCDTPSPGTFCIAQKWAETKMGFASQNFFRPAGNDRFAYDETQVYNICATSNMGAGPGGNNQGAHISLEQTSNCGEVTLASTTGLWGGPAVGGFYEIASTTAATDIGCTDALVVTLGTQIYDIPDTWESAANWGGDNDNGYCFGKLRFSSGNPASDPPPILGRAAVSAIAEYDSESGVTELTTDSLPNLGMILSGNDAVDIYDASMTLISGDLAVTRIDDTHFTVPVAVGTLAGAAWIQSHGSPSYGWNDQYPKGDYAYTTWTWWPRLICEANRINLVNDDCTTGTDCSGCPDTETVYAYPFSDFSQEAGCLPFNPCNPSVICISPNGESFAIGTTYDFPTIDFDETWGSGWQGEVQQVMEDLLYQSPHFPAQGPGCTPDPFAWNADNGTCQGSGGLTYFFAHPPLVECRLTLPAGAPALPSSPTYCGVDEIVIGWSSPVGIVYGDCTPDNTLFPSNANSIGEGGAVGTGLQSSNIWSLWESMCTCVDGDGDFAGNYENVVVGCT